MRTRKSQKNPALLIGVIAAAVVLLAIFLLSGSAGSLFSNRGRDKYGTFSAQTFIENPRNYAGNKYRIKGTVDNILDSAGAGEQMNRLISVAVDGGKFVPVLVPSASVRFALQRGQGVAAYCSIDGGGLPVADAIEKE